MTGAGAIESDAEFEELRVAHELDGSRLDVCLAAAHPEHSRSYLQRCIRAGSVTVNGRAARPAETVHTNDRVRIRWPDPEPPELTPEALPLDIIAEDADVIVLNKPPGLVVHPAKGHARGTLVHRLLSHDESGFRELVDDELRPGIVHRLDKDTSGVMVVARNAAARAALKAAFRERVVEKTYLALVLGEFGAVTGTIRGNIGRHPRQRQRMAVLTDAGKPAVTRYRVLTGNETVSLVEVRIETGRTHQIRVHFAHLRHPVLGDPLYGGRQAEVPIRPPRQMLHAWKLAFPHPATGVVREYMAPIPADFRETLRELGLAGTGSAPVAP